MRSSFGIWGESDGRGELHVAGAIVISKWCYMLKLNYAQQVWFVHCLDQMRSSSGVGESDGRGGELPQVIVKMCHWHFDRMILCWLTGAFDAWCLTCPFCCQFSCQFSFVVDVHQITVWSGMAWRRDVRLAYNEVEMCWTSQWGQWQDCDVSCLCVTKSSCGVSLLAQRQHTSRW